MNSFQQLCPESSAGWKKKHECEDYRALTFAEISHVYELERDLHVGVCVISWKILVLSILKENRWRHSKWIKTNFMQRYEDVPIINT